MASNEQSSLYTVPPREVTKPRTGVKTTLKNLPTNPVPMADADAASEASCHADWWKISTLGEEGQEANMEAPGSTSGEEEWWENLMPQYDRQPSSSVTKGADHRHSIASTAASTVSGASHRSSIASTHSHEGTVPPQQQMGQQKQQQQQLTQQQQHQMTQHQHQFAHQQYAQQQIAQQQYAQQQYAQQQFVQQHQQIPVPVPPINPTSTHSQASAASQAYANQHGWQQMQMQQQQLPAHNMLLGPNIRDTVMMSLANGAGLPNQEGNQVNLGELENQLDISGLVDAASAMVMAQISTLTRDLVAKQMAQQAAGAAMHPGAPPQAYAPPMGAPQGAPVSPVGQPQHYAPQAAFPSPPQAASPSPQAFSPTPQAFSPTPEAFAPQAPSPVPPTTTGAFTPVAPTPVAPAPVTPVRVTPTRVYSIASDRDPLVLQKSPAPVSPEETKRVAFDASAKAAESMDASGVASECDSIHSITGTAATESVSSFTDHDSPSFHSEGYSSKHEASSPEKKSTLEKKSCLKSSRTLDPPSVCGLPADDDGNNNNMKMEAINTSLRNLASTFEWSGKKKKQTTGYSELASVASMSPAAGSSKQLSSLQKQLLLDHARGHPLEETPAQLGVALESSKSSGKDKAKRRDSSESHHTGNMSQPESTHSAQSSTAKSTKSKQKKSSKKVERTSSRKVERTSSKKVERTSSSSLRRAHHSSSQLDTLKNKEKDKSDKEAGINGLRKELLESSTKLKEQLLLDLCEANGIIMEWNKNGGKPEGSAENDLGQASEHESSTKSSSKKRRSSSIKKQLDSIDKSRKQRSSSQESRRKDKRSSSQESRRKEKRSTSQDRRGKDSSDIKETKTTKRRSRSTQRRSSTESKEGSKGESSKGTRSMSKQRSIGRVGRLDAADALGTTKRRSRSQMKTVDSSETAGTGRTRSRSRQVPDRTRSTQKRMDISESKDRKRSSSNTSLRRALTVDSSTPPRPEESSEEKRQRRRAARRRQSLPENGNADAVALVRQQMQDVLMKDKHVANGTKLEAVRSNIVIPMVKSDDSSVAGSDMDQSHQSLQSQDSSKKSRSRRLSSTARATSKLFKELLPSRRSRAKLDVCTEE